MSEPTCGPLPLNESLPPRLRAGDQLNWSVQTCLPAGTLVFFILTGIIGNVPVRLYIAQPSGDPPTGTAVDASGVAAFTLTSAQTGVWEPGSYQWVAFSLDSSGNRCELAQGKIRVEPDPGGTNPADPRTYNEKVLAQIRCVIAGTALDDVQMYKIGGREVTKMSRLDLLKFEGVFEARVMRERRRRGEKVPTKTVGILFGGR